MYVITDQVDEAARLAPEPVRRISQSFKNLGWAGHFTPADADALAAVSTTINAPAGTEIVVEGDDPGCIYLVTDGWLYAGRSLADGRQHIPALMLPGEVCNLDSIQLARADHTIAALTRTRLEKIETASLLHVAWERPAVAAQLLRLLSAEARLRTAWALRPARLNAGERIAHFLCEIAHRLNAAPAADGSLPITLPLTQQQLGNALGVTSVHINRTLRQMEEAMLIDAGTKSVTILDYQALCAAGQFESGYLQCEAIQDGSGSPERLAAE